MATTIALVALVAVAARPAGAEGPHELRQQWRWALYGIESGLSSDSVAEVTETTDGTLWALGAQPAWFDDFVWHCVPLPDDTTRPVHMAADDAGRLLVVTEAGLYRGDRSGFERLAAGESGGASQVTGFSPLPNDELLLCFDQSRVARWRSGVSTPVALPADVDGHESAVGLITLGDGSPLLTSLYGRYRWTGEAWAPRVAAGSTVMAVGAGGHTLIMTEDAVTGEMNVTFGSPGEPEAPVNVGHDERVVAMDVASNGDAIICLTSGGFALRRGGRWHRTVTQPEQLTEVESLYFDRRGDLWACSQYGLMLCRLSERRWTLWETQGQHVNELVRTRDGELWIGAHLGIEVHGVDERVRVIDEADGVPLRIITGLAEDGTGAIWASSGGAMIGVVRLQDGMWKHFDGDDGLPDVSFHRIAIDRRGRPWMLGLSPSRDQPNPGAFVFEDGQFTRWGPDEGLIHGRVYAFAEGRDGAYWFGTLGGISRHRDGAWRHWTRADGLASNRIYTIAVDDEGRLYFGHQHARGGLGCIDLDESVRYYTTADGLLDPGIWEIDGGDDGTLWITTPRGLSCFRDGIFGGFDLSSGLAARRLWPVLVEDDRVIVGSLHGDLHGLSLAAADAPAPRVVMTDPMPDESRVWFRWHAFAHRGRVRPEAVPTRYRFDDGPWSVWSDTREASAIGLAPGTHRLTVQASSIYGRTDEAGVTRTFSIPYPWHRHPVFVAVASLAVVTLVGLTLLHVRQRQVQLVRARRDERRYRALFEESPALLHEADVSCVIEELRRLRAEGVDLASYLAEDPQRVVDVAAKARILDVNRATVAFYGATSKEELAERRYETATDETIAAARTQLLHFAEGRLPPPYETTVRTLDGETRHLSIRTTMPEGSPGEPRIVRYCCVDITERRLNEQRQKLMMLELDHRVKNNLVAVLALAEQTLEQAGSMDEFAEKFAGRIQSLSRAHEALAKSKWTEVQVADMLDLVMSSYQGGDAGRIRCAGSPLRIPPRTAQPMCMSLHELATNAIKHGALSSPEGWIDVKWSLADGDRMELQWSERNGPAVQGSPEPGLGTTLIRGFVEHELGGELELDYRAEGLRCSMSIPLKR